MSPVNMWSVTLEDEYKKNPELKPEYIAEIREWLETQKHLPEIEGKNLKKFFLCLDLFSYKYFLKPLT